MRSTTLVRASIVVHQICLVLLVIGILGFAAMTAANAAPAFSQELVLGEKTLLEIHSGSACPRNMPVYICYGSGLAYRREFRVVYYSFYQRHTLITIRLPAR